jgi:mono/diheme cytochrome c family protein
MVKGTAASAKPRLLCGMAFGVAQRAFIGAACVLLGAAAAGGAVGDAQRGRALFALAAGCGCHTGPDGPVAAGGGKVPTPFGTFYGSNITPEPETGVGHWSDAELAAAIRQGTRRDGSAESPAMPYYQYAGMSDTDVADLIAYLRTLPAVRRPNRAHEGELPLPRWSYRVWRWLFVPRTRPPRVAPAHGVERGRYLANHVSICTDCHTPRTWLGAPDTALYLAGSTHGPAGQQVPNITPSKSGIGDWGADDITNVLTLGMLPDFDNVQGLMADVVDGHGGGPGFKDAPLDDLQAIGAYLKVVPPIEHDVGGD